MSVLAIIGSIIVYVVVFVLTMMMIHYAFARVRSAFRSVFGKH